MANQNQLNTYLSPTVFIPIPHSPRGQFIIHLLLVASNVGDINELLSPTLNVSQFSPKSRTSNVISIEVALHVKVAQSVFMMQALSSSSKSQHFDDGHGPIFYTELIVTRYFYHTNGTVSTSMAIAFEGAKQVKAG